MSKGRIILSIVGFALGLWLLISGLNNIIKGLEAENEYQQAQKELIEAEKDLAYEYGKCVFYDKVPLEVCNNASGQTKGFELYEKYYGDGSWTVEADPFPFD